MFPERFLIPARVSLDNQAGSKKRVLEEISRLLATSSLALKQNLIFDKLLERERLGSTGLGHGIALPHARFPGIETACGAFVRLNTAVDFDAIDGLPIDLVFGLLVPEQATEEHLQLLAQLARVFSSTAFCTRLRNIGDTEILVKAILSGK